MTDARTPDPERGARFLKKLLEDDPAHLDVATDDEVEAMMDAAGVQVKRVPTVDELFTLAGRIAAPRAPAVAPMPRSRARRMSSASLTAAMALVAVGVVALMSRETILAHLRGDVATPRPPPTAVPTPEQRAVSLRAEAFAACDARRWDVCARKLDEAKTLDPAGDSDPRVTAARKAAADATKE